MKLEDYLLQQLLKAGDALQAGNVVLSHFGRSPMPHGIEVRINRSGGNDDHVLIYYDGDWYEWNSAYGFRTGGFGNGRIPGVRNRIVIWLRG